jgi:hypothetical protein
MRIQTLSANDPSVSFAAGKPSVEDLARRRLSQGQIVSGKLRTAALAAGDAEALALADMLHEASARHENVRIGRGLHDPSSELFDVPVSLVVVGSRLDPGYRQACSRRAYRRALESLKRVEPQTGERFYFLTLTMPEMSGTGFRKSVEVLRRAFELFRKRSWMPRHVRGAIFSEEFTVGEDGESFHVHKHGIACARQIDREELGRQWTACLEASAGEHDMDMRFSTATGYACVDVTPIEPSYIDGRAISREESIERVCRYLVKGSEYERIPADQLLEVERVLYHRRLIECFGECNARRGRVEKPVGSSLDIQSTIDGPVALPAASPSADPEGDTPVGRHGKQTLRKIGAELIREGKRGEWLNLLRETYGRRRAYQRAQLGGRYPRAVFSAVAEASR